MMQSISKHLWAPAAACFMGLAPLPASASTSTPAIIANTVSAAPSCLKYQVEGVCFFLQCSYPVCYIRTSIKISHYVPDVVVSTYNAPLMHPWADIGKPVAAAMTTAGSTVTGFALDSSAGGLSTDSSIASFKGADAIGNPAGQFAAMLAGGGALSMPSSIVVPNVTELASFSTKGLSEAGRSWVNVPSSIAETVGKDAKAMLSAPEALLGSISTVMRAIEGVEQVMNIMDTVQQVQGVVEGLQQISSVVTGIAGGNTLFCPGGASFFGLHFQSELDAPFWRGIVPAEMLYAQAWIPGLNEVGAGFSQTWGSVYPRTGEIIQPHPVKASAVLAERVASIIYKSAQPHIYTKVTPSGTGRYRYFNVGEHRRWQMLSPKPSTKCVEFGSNDSLSLTSWGDGQTDSADGYAWNLWQRYTCCRRRGLYLYSVP